MSNFNQAVDTVKQGGRRRGALMGILNYNHPEILNFVRAKLQGKLENFNLSILVDDSFMKLVDTNEKISLKSPLGYEVDKIKAKDLFDLSCWVAWSCGDPAFLFQDRVNKDNPFIKEFVLDTCNPCSEVFLPHYGACTLGSLNIQKFIWKNDFNFERFEEFCKLGMRALTNINKISFYPLYQIKECMDKYNPVGLGIMGFADCLIRLGINYDSKDCLDFIDKVGSSWKKATEEFAGDTFYFYKRVIAPTGSLSILGDCSSGIEPVYDTTFERRLTVGVIEETRELYKSKFVRTAYQVSPEWHVKVLARWQKWADGGISKTINLPYNCSADDVKNAFIMAWKMGCKGVSIFRDRSRSQVLISTSSSHQPWAGKCSDAECSL
jgi:ribonucleoside-diphosphate reductase alpha chain